MGRAFAGVGVALVVAGSLAACGVSQGEPEPEVRIELASHPCDVLGPESLDAAGLNGREPKRLDDKDEPFQRRTCSFVSRNPDASALISFNVLTLAQVDEDDGADLREATEVGGHRAMVHVMARAKSCLVSVEITPGILEVMVGYNFSPMDTPEKACDFALQVARDLAPYFPDRLWGLWWVVRLPVLVLRWLSLDRWRRVGCRRGSLSLR